MGYHAFRYRSLFKNKLVLGFYESPMYFDCIADMIRNGLSVDESSSIVKEIIEDIEGHIAIAVGIRRGDFASEKNKDFCDICTPEYYENGIRLISRKLKESGHVEEKQKVYIFTEDVIWAQENISCNLPVRYITSSVEGDLKPWEMMQVLSHCKHQVISNSSFFWWGQYLNDSQDKIVVAPAKWRSQDSEIYNDIYQSSWICISPE